MLKPGLLEPGRSISAGSSVSTVLSDRAAFSRGGFAQFLVRDLNSWPSRDDKNRLDSLYPA